MTRRPGAVLEPGDFKRALERFQKDEMTKGAAAITYFLMLPLFPGMSDEQQDYVIDRLAAHLTAVVPA